MSRRRSDPAKVRPSPTPAQSQKVFLRVVTFGLLMLGAIGASALPLPWLAIGAVFSLAALVAGVRALIAVWTIGPRGPLVAMLAIGLVMSGLIFLSALTVLATWPIQQARQDCLDRALTVSARQTCEDDYQRAIKDLVTPATP